MASTTGQVLPDSKLERRTRRRFTEEEKVALLEELQRENDRLRKRLDLAEGLVSLQKKLHALLETDEKDRSR